MTTKHLAYLALLAGWICFCYWLYAKGISPRLQRTQEKSWPEYLEDLPYPMAFRWASDVPLAGPGFGELQVEFADLDSIDELVIVKGFFFRDEAGDISQLRDLGHRRIGNVLKWLEIDQKRMLTEVSVQEISADVKANPFEAVRFERIRFADAVSITSDTIELCFPVKDLLRLPQICTDRMNTWIEKSSKQKDRILHIVGTADGSGIAEPMDIAMDRAMMIKKLFMEKGWKEENIQLSTGQRNQPLTLRNRCVVVYFE